MSGHDHGALGTTRLLLRRLQQRMGSWTVVAGTPKDAGEPVSAEDLVDHLPAPVRGLGDVAIWPSLVTWRQRPSHYKNYKEL